MSRYPATVIEFDALMRSKYPPIAGDIIAQAYHQEEIRKAREEVTSKPTRPLALFLDGYNGHLIVAFDALDAELIMHQARNCGLIEAEHAIWIRSIEPDQVVSLFIDERFGDRVLRRREAMTAAEWARTQTRGILAVSGAVMA